MIKRYTIFSLLTPIIAFSSMISEGDDAWKNRGNNFFKTGFPDSAASRIAVKRYSSELRRNPQDLDTRFKLMEALYFLADFVASDKNEKRELIDRGLRLSQVAIAIVENKAGLAGEVSEQTLEVRAGRLESIPEAARAHFWSAIYWGFWGMTFGNLAAARADVAGKVKYHAQMLILLDETYADAGGYRILGKLHTAAPKIPFFTGWIDRNYGIQLLRKANRMSDLDPRNPLFLAEAIIRYEPEHTNEAVTLLTNLSHRKPAPEYVVEQTKMMNEARGLLEQIHHQ